MRSICKAVYGNTNKAVRLLLSCPEPKLLQNDRHPFTPSFLRILYHGTLNFSSANTLHLPHSLIQNDENISDHSDHSNHPDHPDHHGTSRNKGISEAESGPNIPLVPYQPSIDLLYTKPCAFIASATLINPAMLAPTTRLSL